MPDPLRVGSLLQGVFSADECGSFKFSGDSINSNLVSFSSTISYLDVGLVIPKSSAYLADPVLLRLELAELDDLIMFGSTGILS